jgi:hypothetical protein
MSFVAPLVLLGLGALAVPVILHLIQREKKQIVEFPSLMFIRRIPYQSVRRRRIRNWLLLAVRLVALALIVLAFARPFFRRQELAAAAQNGARELVILLDSSYSMGYGDRWSRATAAARNAVNGLGPGDKASLVLFSTGADARVRSTSDRAKLASAVVAASPGPGATRFPPALKLAGSLLADSALPRHEVVLISDFQRRGWDESAGRADVRLPQNTIVTPIAIGDANTTNLAVTPVTLQRTRFENQDRVVVTAGVTNHSAAAAHVPLALEVGGQQIQSLPVDVASHASATVTFAPFTVASRNMRADVRIPDDRLARDNVFYFVVSPSEPIRTYVVDRPGAESESFYFARALGIGDAPRVEPTVRTLSSLTDADLRTADVVVLNDAPVDESTAGRLRRFVNEGGGMLVAAGPHASWPTAEKDLLPALPSSAVDRSSGTPLRLGALEYSHPVFELFRAPRSGDFSSPRFYSYRAVDPPSTTALARFDDGAVALAERKTGAGRVLLWTSTLDLGWNDLPLKPVYLPLVHTMTRYLADYTERPAALTVGQVVPAPRGSALKSATPSSIVVLSPSGVRGTANAEDGAIELTEQGFYDIRAQGAGGGGATVLASDVDLSESDLTAMDPRELVAGLTGRPADDRSPFSGMRPSDDAQAQAQRLWWYLLIAAGLLLAAETLISNRPQKVL